MGSCLNCPTIKLSLSKAASATEVTAINQLLTQNDSFGIVCSYLQFDTRKHSIAAISVIRQVCAAFRPREMLLIRIR